MSRALTLSLLALAFGGCSNSFTDNGKGPDDTGNTSDPSVDNDGDGLSENQGDCDDTDPDISPDATEIPYDGVDNDCDPSTPDEDLDGDGFNFEDCNNDCDCDDEDEDTYPGAEEVPYDDIDQDCDGEDLLDADGDGYEGDEVGGDDCDDDDDTVYPGAPEVIDDEVDNDCDGEVDERFSVRFIDAGTWVEPQSAIAVDSSGQLHVAYKDDNADYLVYNRRDTDRNWVGVQAVSGAGTGSADYLDAVIDANDRFQIAYTYKTWDGMRLEFIYRDADGDWAEWSIVNDKYTAGTEDLGYFVSIDVDSTNLPSFAYYDAGAGEPMLTDYTNFGVGLHVQVDINYSGSTGYYTSLAIDQDGYDHVVYYDPSALFGFSPEVQYTSLNLDLNSVVFSETVDEKGYYTSVAMRSDNVPCVAYQAGYSADLRYGCYESGNWSLQTVDSEGSVGAYAALAFNGSDEPYIAYYDESHADLKVARLSGGSWEVMTVDSSGSVGQAPSIAIDSKGIVYISYYDASSESLKLAEGR